jgi:hypothetical protein
LQSIGVPRLTVALAGEYAAAYAARIGRSVPGAMVDSLTYLPFFCHPNPGRPAAPMTWGNGALCVDLGPDDAETWANFVAHGDPGEDVDEAAAAAQEWRLPVTPFRLPRQVPPDGLAAVRDVSVAADHSPISLEGVRVLDLTSMWAGPLCTGLLAGAGATVIKIEPMNRPDGLRYGDGDHGLGLSPMFRALNSRKVSVPWNLEHSEDREAFNREVKRCDLVVTSLSPRAIDNLTITHGDLKEVNPSLRTLAVTAFAAGSPEADWIAYGPGVHAALGLGWDGARHHAPALSYPDPLAGLMAASVAVDQLTGIAGADERVSLAEAAAPLAAEKPPFELTDTAVLNEMWRGQPSDGLRHLLELS